jgi:Tol biopolymer transport system component/DNA-binding winged helix-turn-helix (wHTH) protein
MSVQDRFFYEFGEFRLDARERALWKGEEFLPLAPKVFDTLQLLVENQGKILSKREMMEALWADAFVEESNLSQNIYTLRRILGKDAIENIPRRGYRFTAPVCRASEIRTDGTKEILIASQTRVLTEEIYEEDAPAPRELPAQTPAEKKEFILRSPLVLFSALAVLLSISIFASFRYVSTKTQRTPVESVNFQKLTFSGDVELPIMAPDGNSFAFVRDNNLFVQDFNSPNPTRINVPDITAFGFTQFSHDGKSLYFRAHGGVHLPANIYQVSRFGGAAQLVAQDVWSGFSLSAGGRLLTFIRSNPQAAEYSLIIKNLETGVERSVCSYKLPARFFLGGYPSFSPDGKHIATVVLKQGGYVRSSQLIIVETENGKVEEIDTPALQQLEQVVWLPGDSRALLVVGREPAKFFQLWWLDLSSRELKRVTNDLNSYRNLSISADGKKILARHHITFSHIWLASREDLLKARQLTFGNMNRDGTVGLVFSPDGSLIYTSRIYGDIDLWHLNPKDESRRQLTEKVGDSNIEPTVSPDGNTVFFNSTRSGALRLWRMDIKGENQTQLTFTENETERFPQVSPDGRWLYFIQRGRNVSTIQRKSLSDGKTEILFKDERAVPDAFLALSPDGRFLAFDNSTARKNGAGKEEFQIGVIPTEGGSEPRFFNLSSSPRIVRWSSDAQSFDYAENNPEGAKIWRQSLDSSQPRKLVLELPDERIFYFAWSPDGKSLAVARGKQTDDAVLLTNFQP